jgi:Spy/CpxP family protein refolding chaperone
MLHLRMFRSFLIGLIALVLVNPCWAQQVESSLAGQGTDHEHDDHQMDEAGTFCPSSEGGSHYRGMRGSAVCCPCMRRGSEASCPMMEAMQGMMKHSGMSAGRMRRGQMAVVIAHAAVPGIPGASHLYHIGAKGFFLNHAERLDLSDEQKQELNKIRERAVLDRAKRRAEIKSMELDVWQLTGLDKPNMSDIEAKIRSLEKARSDTRLNYLREVERAVNVLTEQQRRLLLMGDGKREDAKEASRVMDEGSTGEEHEDEED